MENSKTNKNHYKNYINIEKTLFVQIKKMCKFLILNAVKSFFIPGFDPKSQE